jgi:mono/diheme cytochrome c family protein
MAREHSEQDGAVRRRFMLLATVISVALVAAACGRATDDQINQALGITPTPTLSAEAIASSTALAGATATAHALALSSPSAVALGDVKKGQDQFMTWCSGCHSPGGSGPDILSPGSAGAKVTADSLLPLVREGKGHTPPGPFKATEITDKQVKDIAAYLHASAGG